ncbi:type II toxin-antitoxin system VapC family toxin [Nitrospirillum amazonense]|uniref:Ribonuclease VapC n=1 Tax=Nitrospirillum amazonense TaxID=28077 RepID=A0A560JB51_9PROT|nr:type II toxin-antitoxin system VapC family toxin [Nitrospirillum amazonense]MDG3442517.1 type II toxin-antitoxin system VapC family toxin [Nitrospirillum amazonense]TWB68408.1 putative nucleic acid-binding protein [Nitrospirillum amazonense]
MPFVVDVSVAASWLMPDEGCDAAIIAFERLVTDPAVVPSLWWFEIRNMLLVNERRRRLDEMQTARALALLAQLPIRVDNSPDSAIVMRLARQHRLTAYDAAYLELAQRLAVPLATLDDALVRAAHADGVTLVG